uniref:platelet glycoprotein Ib alpha chain-like n=1 Tax=Oncorhynchus gorbuscha TaxID=8017 RepID=UPI001EAE90DD|nr:platelet glycoprotein Ib alpha chain-like [Oncorhynchus gorbuscha]
MTTLQYLGISVRFIIESVYFDLQHMRIMTSTKKATWNVPDPPMRSSSFPWQSTPMPPHYNPPPVAAQELSDTIAPQETSYTLTQVEPPISPTTQETSYTLTQVEPPISPTTQETSYTLILNQVEPPIIPTTQETSYTLILNQVEPPIIPTTQETSYTQTKEDGEKDEEKVLPCHPQNPPTR